MSDCLEPWVTAGDAMSESEQEYAEAPAGLPELLQAAQDRLTERKSYRLAWRQSPLLVHLLLCGGKSAESR